MLFVSPGLTSYSHTPYVQQIVKQMTIQGFDVVVINYRGLASAPLTTPRLYTANGWEDVLEPMKYVYEKYCRPHNKKAFAMGCSMGAGILGNLLGHEGANTFLEAATFVNPSYEALLSTLARMQDEEE